MTMPGFLMSTMVKQSQAIIISTIEVSIELSDMRLHTMCGGVTCYGWPGIIRGFRDLRGTNVALWHQAGISVALCKYAGTSGIEGTLGPWHRWHPCETWLARFCKVPRCPGVLEEMEDGRKAGLCSLTCTQVCIYLPT